MSLIFYTKKKLKEIERKAKDKFKFVKELELIRHALSEDYNKVSSYLKSYKKIYITNKEKQIRQKEYYRKYALKNRARLSEQQRQRREKKRTKSNKG